MYISRKPRTDASASRSTSRWYALGILYMMLYIICDHESWTCDYIFVYICANPSVQLFKKYTLPQIFNPAFSIIRGCNSWRNPCTSSRTMLVMITCHGNSSVQYIYIYTRNICMYIKANTRPWFIITPIIIYIYTDPSVQHFII